MMAHHFFKLDNNSYLKGLVHSALIWMKNIESEMNVKEWANFSPLERYFLSVTEIVWLLTGCGNSQPGFAFRFDCYTFYINTT